METSVAFDYDRRYYEVASSNARRSAEVILPLILGIVKPASILDVGCGIGSWLAVAQSFGISDILGIDGEWVYDSGLLISERCVRTALLSEHIDLERRFDLAICVEVAEHLPKEFSSNLIDILVRHSPVILFSAAIPDQGGEGHVNEAQASHWRTMFSARGYVCFDPVRLAFWNHDEVDPWYRQNTRMFVACTALQDSRVLQESLLPYPPMLDDLVHPVVFRTRLEERAKFYMERIHELAEWGVDLQKRVDKYEMLFPATFFLRCRQFVQRMTRKFR